MKKLNEIKEIIHKMLSGIFHKGNKAKTSNTPIPKIKAKDPNTTIPDIPPFLNKEVLNIIKKSQNPNGMLISEIHEILLGSFRISLPPIHAHVRKLISEGLVYQSNPGFGKNRLYKAKAPKAPTPKISAPKDEILNIIKNSKDPDGIRVSEIRKMLSGIIRISKSKVYSDIEELIRDGSIYQTNPGFKCIHLYKAKAPNTPIPKIPAPKDAILNIIKNSKDPDGIGISEIRKMLSGIIRISKSKVYSDIEELIRDGSIYQTNPGFKCIHLYKAKASNTPIPKITAKDPNTPIPKIAAKDPNTTIPDIPPFLKKEVLNIIKKSQNPNGMLISEIHEILSRSFRISLHPLYAHVQELICEGLVYQSNPGFLRDRLYKAKAPKEPTPKIPAPKDEILNIIKNSKDPNGIGILEISKMLSGRFRISIPTVRKLIEDLIKDRVIYQANNGVGRGRLYKVRDKNTTIHDIYKARHPNTPILLKKE